MEKIKAILDEGLKNMNDYLKMESTVHGSWKEAFSKVTEDKLIVLGADLSVGQKMLKKQDTE
jgi:hypothetical protein